MEQVAQKLTHMLYEQRSMKKSLKSMPISPGSCITTWITGRGMQAQTDIANNLIRLKNYPLQSFTR